MEFPVEIVKTVVSGIVWITALLVFGRLGMFVATKWFFMLQLRDSRERQEGRRSMHHEEA